MAPVNSHGKHQRLANIHANVFHLLSPVQYFGTRLPYALPPFEENLLMAVADPLKAFPYSTQKSAVIFTGRHCRQAV